MQRMENMYSRSKSSLFQQDFLSSLPNDLNIHFIHFCRSTFTGGVSVKNSSLYTRSHFLSLPGMLSDSFSHKGGKGSRC